MGEAARSRRRFAVFAGSLELQQGSPDLASAISILGRTHDAPRRTHVCHRWHRRCRLVASDVEVSFHYLARSASLLIDAAAVVVVTFGALEAFVRLLALASRPSATHGARKEVWRRFAAWLLLGLEFELAADIIGSVISPTWMDIGQLAAIAVIRTFLNYFLERDIESADQAAA